MLLTGTMSSEPFCVRLTELPFGIITVLKPSLEASVNLFQ